MRGTSTLFNEELLRIIFTKIESTAQLGQCRLVCKSWKDAAAKIMFSRRLTISSEIKAIKLYRHLFNDPAKAKNITHLHFNLSDTKLPAIIKELLSLTITSSIRHLTGTVKAKKFFTVLFAIMDDPSLDLTQLKTLPEFMGEDSNVKLERFTRLKKTLEKMTLTLGMEDDEMEKRYIKQLDGCMQLTTLTLKGYLPESRRLEHILRRCPQLTKLNLVYLEFGGIRAFAGQSAKSQQKEVYAWSKKKVQQENNMEAIEIRSPCRPELLEYLDYKYPFNFSINVKGKLHMNNYSASLASGNLDRILDAVANVPYKQMSLVLSEGVKVKDLVLFMKRRGLNYDLDVQEINGREKLLMSVRWEGGDWILFTRSGRAACIVIT